MLFRSHHICNEHMLPMCWYQLASIHGSPYDFRQVNLSKLLDFQIFQVTVVFYIHALI